MDAMARAEAAARQALQQQEAPIFFSEDAQQLLQLLEQQPVSVALQPPPRVLQKPQEHYLTIAHDGRFLGELCCCIAVVNLTHSSILPGSILEATHTVTGFPPEALLMTSVYDNVYDEDLPGFLGVKTQFWDVGQNVPIYLRRRSLEAGGHWMWLRSQVLTYVQTPISGTILHEEIVSDHDVAWAKRYNRITRITAILVQAVEAAILQDSQPLPEPEPDQVEMANAESTDEAPGGFDPFSLMESVRQGVRLDFGLTRLFPEEIQLIALVLSGRIPVREVAPLVLDTIQREGSLEDRLKPLMSQLSPKGDVELPLLPPICVLNMSYTYMGNVGMELLGQILYQKGSSLQTIDLSFCGLSDKGITALAKALQRRKRASVDPLQCLILSGNHISARTATELGSSLSPSDKRNNRKRLRHTPAGRSGYDSDSADSFEDEEDEDDDFRGISRKSTPPTSSPKKRRSSQTGSTAKPQARKGLQVLHVANASLTAQSLRRFLAGLGPKCTVRELNLASNQLGVAGATSFVQFLETNGRSDGTVPMPALDRLDMSNNQLGDDGTTQLTRAILQRSKDVDFVDLKLSSNSIGSGGVESMMNRLLQHNLVSLSLDKNSIGDQGCQLVAASLNTMRSLSRLNLGFNQIGSRGINSLMRSLLPCESITYLGLSGNILKISGAIALAFTLSQHPRLEELDLDNCCLGQAAQCHITAGAISNRWVPMKRLTGYAVGPPMVAIGALKPYAQNLSNEECFRIRKDEQMKTILQWMESNRNARRMGAGLGFDASGSQQAEKFLTPEFVSNINDVQGTPSQNAYFRLLGWLSRIPFDDDELTALQKFFFDSDGGEGDRGSDGYINLKLRGDLLAALDSGVADEIRDDLPNLYPDTMGSVGIDLAKLESEWNAWDAFVGKAADDPPKMVVDDNRSSVENEIGESAREELERGEATGALLPGATSLARTGGLQHSESSTSTGKEKKTMKVKPRIAMFPQFEQQLEELKAAATEMIEREEDPLQHEIILTQYAEASLTILRQLRYHCMNSGLDGWRQVGLKRKVLIVDDSNLTRKLVSRAFEKANFIVDTASNGAEGVEKLKQSIYDIAFMDIDMPVMNGFEATKQLRQWEDEKRPGARQPICALTAAYVDDFERSELMKFKEAGLDVMESKPCNIPRLFKVVDDVSPMFSDLSISVIQRERSDSNLAARPYPLD